MKDKLILKFNPDGNTVREIKDAASILRDLIKTRERLKESGAGGTTDEWHRFTAAFDTMTQNIEAE